MGEVAAVQRGFFVAHDSGGDEIAVAGIAGSQSLSRIADGLALPHCPNLVQSVQTDQAAPGLQRLLEETSGEVQQQMLASVRVEIVQQAVVLAASSALGGELPQGDEDRQGRACAIGFEPQFGLTSSLGADDGQIL